MRIVKSDNVTTIGQDGYVEKILARFNLETANSADTPGLPGQILSKEDCPDEHSAEQKEMSQKPFRSLVGSLMYAYIGTRPDIGAALVKTAAFCMNPGVSHWVAAKRIARYLKGTVNQTISYSGQLKSGDKIKITAFADSDWAQDRDDRKSTSGYVVMLSGGPVSWQCRKQPTRALSSCEAEFIALTEVTKEVLWLTYFLGELGIDFETPIIYTDSRSAMEWSKNASNHQRTKHVALKYFFIRDEVANKSIKIAYVSTKDNVADILTKSTTKAIYKHLQPKLMGTIWEKAQWAWKTVKCFGKGERRNI
jgi:hypothetical protein